MILLLVYSCSDDSQNDGIFNPEKPTSHEKRSCDMHDHMEELLKDPTYRKKHTEKMNSIRNMVDTRAADCVQPIAIPVAVHFQSITGADKACLVELAKRQVAVINDDFRGTNPDINLWTQGAAASFPGIDFGDACLTFCLATENHPSGYNLSNGDAAVTLNQTEGDESADWSGYMNIFVRGGTGVLGYAPLGGSGQGDGVVIDASAFGSGSGCGQVDPQAPYNLGRTLTHEIGHYFLLDHIWGGGCGADDEVVDTPESDEPYYDCPDVGASTCGSTDMHMNYMDYVNDACMYVFSDGQATRMRNYINANLQNFITKGNSTCGGVVAEPTCTDGIQNGDEAGVDCGGSCDPCNGEEPTCTDGIQNGDETGVDCGGSCTACEEESTCADGIQNGDETGVDCGGSCAPCEEEPIDGCMAPTSISIADASATSIMLTWTEVPDAIRYRVAYRRVGENRWSRVTARTPSTTIRELSPDVEYEVRVRSVCSGERSAWSEIITFALSETGGEDCINFQLSLSLNLDDYPEETTWLLYNYDTGVVAEGGPYDEVGGNISEQFCIEDGCYAFEVYDAYGDGICCDYGEGNYVLTDGDGQEVFSSDGGFSDIEYVDFCVENGEAVSFSLRRSDTPRNKARKARKR